MDMKWLKGNKRLEGQQYVKCHELVEGRETGIIGKEELTDNRQTDMERIKGHDKDSVSQRAKVHERLKGNSMSTHPVMSQHQPICQKLL